MLYKLEKTLRKQYANVLHIFNDDDDGGNPEGPHDYRRDRDERKSSSSRKYSHCCGLFDGSVNAMSIDDGREYGSDDDDSEAKPPDQDPDAGPADDDDSENSSDQKQVEIKEEGDLDEEKEIPPDEE